MRWRRAIAALLLVPLVDSALLVVVAGRIGWIETVALVVLTGLLGSLLVRAEGRHTLRAITDKLDRAELPTDELLDGGLLIAAGAFLLTPGLVTDAIGFLFAVPVTRYPVREALKRYVVRPYLNERLDGLATGTAWEGGFPDPGTTPGSGSDSAGGTGDRIDLGPDDYRVDEEDGNPPSE